MTYRTAALLICLALAACGGGGGGSSEPASGAFTVFGGETRTTANASIQLMGSAFVPAGASCNYYPGPFAPPSCSCEAGHRATGQWANAATGATGPLQLGVLGNSDCTPIATAWVAGGIALERGSNPISLAMTDGSTRGAATVTVQRE